MKSIYSVVILVLLIGGCASNNVEIQQLQYDVKKLQAEVFNHKNNQHGGMGIKVLKPRELNIQGISYGGIVRSEASTSSPRLMSLRYGEKVSLMGRTSALKDSYYWFKIRSPSGVIGYQWGGLLCSFSNQSIGAFRLCANFQ
jgi:hypothetical protein